MTSGGKRRSNAHNFPICIARRRCSAQRARIQLRVTILVADHGRWLRGAKVVPYFKMDNLAVK
jgi:hypothetical protein